MPESKAMAKRINFLTLNLLLVSGVFFPPVSSAKDSKAYSACLKQINYLASQPPSYTRCYCQDVPGAWMVCEPDTVRLFHGLHPERHGFHFNEEQQEWEKDGEKE